MYYFERTYGDGNSSELNEVTGKDFDVKNHRTLFCLPGDGVSSFTKENDEDRNFQEMVHGNYQEMKRQFQQHANGLLKITKRILGGREALQDDQIILAAYPYDFTQVANEENRNIYNMKDPAGFYSENARNFVTDNLLGLMVNNPVLKDAYKNDKDGKLVKLPAQKLTGEKLSEEDLAKNMSNLNFFAFSHGTVFAGEICNCMKKYMRDMRYDEAEIKNALGNVNLMGISSVIQTSKPDTMYFKAVHFQSVDDVVVKNILPEFKSYVKNMEITSPVVERLDEKSARVLCNSKNMVEFFTNREKTPIRQELDQKKHQPRLLIGWHYKGDNTQAVMAENVLRNMFFKDKKIEKIEDYFIRDSEKISIPTDYNFEKEAHEPNKPINDKIFVKFSRRVLNEHIKDIVDISLKQGIYK